MIVNADGYWQVNEQSYIEFAPVAIYRTSDRSVIEGILSDGMGEFIIFIENLIL
jgi:hypothetical protein